MFNLFKKTIFTGHSASSELSRRWLLFYPIDKCPNKETEKNACRKEGISILEQETMLSLAHLRSVDWTKGGFQVCCYKVEIPIETSPPTKGLLKE